MSDQPNPYLSMVGPGAAPAPGADAAANPYASMVAGGVQTAAPASTGSQGMPTFGQAMAAPVGMNYIAPEQTGEMLHGTQQQALTGLGATLGTVAGELAPPPFTLPAAYAGRIGGAVIGDGISQGIDYLRGISKGWNRGETGSTATGAAIPTLGLTGAGVGKTAAAALINTAGGVAAKQVEVGINEKRPVTILEATQAADSGLTSTAVQRIMASSPDAGPTTKELRQSLVNKSRELAQADGYVFPAAEQGKGATANFVESQAGSADLRRQMQAANQENTNEIAKADMGLPPNRPIQPPNPEDPVNQPGDILLYRKAQYEPYRQVAAISAQARDVAAQLEHAQLGSGDYHDLQIAADNPVYKKQMASLADISGADLDALQLARSEASQSMAAYKTSGNRQALEDGRAAEAKAADLQAKFEAGAAAAGRPDLVSAVQQARVNISKSHVYESAYNPATGDIDAGVVGNTYSEIPLTGGLGKIARANLAFQPYVKDISAMLPTGQSKLNGTGAAIIGAASGHPIAAVIGKGIGMVAGPAASRAAGNFAMSPWYQRNIVPPSYSPVQVPNQGLMRYLSQQAMTPPSPSLLNQYAQPGTP